MKAKKSMFAKLLALALPMAAISVVTPIVLTSCGSSTSETNKTQASWDTTKTQDGLTFDTTNNSAIITLGSGKFANTDISKSSKFDDIKKSLDPSSTGTTLYSVLSGAIKDVGNYDVKLSIDNNPVVFDYSNDTVGNYFNGEFQLTPKSGTNGPAVNLNFRVNNFNDSYNGTSGEDLKWNVNAIEEALATKNSGSSGTGNNLPDVQPKDNGASVTINLAGQTFGKDKKPIALGYVMDELCKSSISANELEGFIDSNNNYNLGNATISSWAPSVDGTTVFTRIVVPSKTSDGREAILYIAYTGFKNDGGNGVWNRNISYPGNSNAWDSKWKEPVIYLSKLNGNIGNTSISKNSTFDDVTDIGKITQVVHYMKDNYIMGSDNFNLCFTGVKDNATPSNNTIVPGNFKDGVFERDSSNPPFKGENNTAVELKFFLEPKNNDTSASTQLMGSDPKGPTGIWRSFYIVYKDNGNSNK